MKVYLRIAKSFGRLAIRSGFNNATHVYTFSVAGLEIMEAARAQGLKTVVEQPAAANEVEEEIMKEERERYPDWEPYTACKVELGEFSARQKREWDLADQIVVPSKFVAASLETVGVPAERCVTVPYGVDDSFSQIERKPHKGPLRVLMVGGVRLQKGPQYINEAAKLLREDSFDFRLVGPSYLSDSAKAQFNKNINLVGSVPRSEIHTHYQWADVLLFPSLCDGFGLVLLEALAAGIPVITTPNTGVAIRDEIDGYLVPIRDAKSIAERLNQLASDPNLLSEMSLNARERSAEFSLDAYGDRLYSAITDKS